MKFNCLNDLDIVPSIVFRFCQSGFCDVKVCSLNNYWFVQLMVEMSFVNIKHLIEVVSLSRVPHEGALRASCPPQVLGRRARSTLNF